MMVIGALLLVDAPIPEMRIRLLTALAVSLPIAAITVFLMGIAYRARRNKVATGSEGMIGEIGTARSALTPEGKVFVHGEIWNAICPEQAAPGDRVVVKQVRGLELVVARLDSKVNLTEAIA
jgi:membrane-bound serine protease (ClpP class)